MPPFRATCALVSIATVVAAIDQLTKLALLAAIGPRQDRHRLDLVDGWVALEYAENRGAAFGSFAGFGPALTIASIVILAGLLVHYMRQADPSLWETVAIGAIIGGAVGNLLDRIRLGYVVDFLAIGAWPNFNVADSAITLGALVLIWGWTRFESRLDIGKAS